MDKRFSEEEEKIFKKYFNETIINEVFNVENEKLEILINKFNKYYKSFLVYKALQLEEEKNLTNEEKKVLFDNILMAIYNLLKLSNDEKNLNT